MQEYRIKEDETVNPHHFIVEVKVVKVVGYWFWKREEVNWVPANVDGEPYGTIFKFPSWVIGHTPILPPKLKYFLNLPAAKNMVDRFNAVQKHSKNEFKIHSA